MDIDSVTLEKSQSIDSRIASLCRNPSAGFSTSYTPDKYGVLTPLDRLMMWIPLLIGIEILLEELGQGVDWANA
jgi:hypothetical protein